MCSSDLNYVGKNALGSIEAVLFLTRLPFTFAIGVGGGISILVSKYFGAKNFEKLKAVSYIGLRVSFVMGAILAIVFFFKFFKFIVVVECT